MRERIRFYLNRLGERLWLKPLISCVLSISGAFIAKLADHYGMAAFTPEITPESVVSLLTVMSNSMLVIATFSVASMLSAYTSASNTATPRSFALVIADDVSQNALSVFVGAFIYSIVALVSIKNGYYDKAGHFTLFVLTLLVFAIVIITFVHWVDRVARLGRLGPTIIKVERATREAIKRRKQLPRLGGQRIDGTVDKGEALCSDRIGYVQRIDMDILQKHAEDGDYSLIVAALPGTFVARDCPLLYVKDRDPISDQDVLKSAFIIGPDRTFDEDPGFGIKVLSEIACRALSESVNDPGTAIDVISAQLRLLCFYSRPVDETDEKEPPVRFNRVYVPELSSRCLFESAFRAISRDGAGKVEVVSKLLAALCSLSCGGDGEVQRLAKQHGRDLLVRAEKMMLHERDLESVREAAAFCQGD
ncbi:DUF2254 domain-containing protein [Hahella ganghwensis]|uniref:DUF2254 domain-containing protein n=1 Tax=Hahella ganghwensis TaxID=286420 RepID=UPI0003A72E38|nr:DUF2254 domain-containing protein [Hahella ganghwensis]